MIDQLGIKVHWERFSFKVFESEYNLGFESTTSRRDLLGYVRKVTLPTCLWMYFINWKVFSEQGARAGIWKYLFHSKEAGFD